MNPRSLIVFFALLASADPAMAMTFRKACGIEGGAVNADGECICKSTTPNADADLTPYWNFSHFEADCWSPLPDMSIDVTSACSAGWLPFPLTRGIRCYCYEHRKRCDDDTCSSCDGLNETTRQCDYQAFYPQGVSPYAFCDASEARMCEDFCNNNDTCYAPGCY